jgi:K+-sensing histidine kinase KdpD
MDRSGRTSFGAALGSLSSLFAAALLVGVRGEVANANVALVLVVCVLLGAVTGGRAAGAAAALVAAASFDFFHTRPYNSLKMTDGNDIIATLLLLVVGLAVGEIAVRWRHVRAVRDDERRQLRRLDRITGLLSHGEQTDDLALAIAAELIETLGLRVCYFERRPYLGSFARMEPTGTATTGVHWYTRDGFELPRDGVELPVEGGGKVLGRFVLLPTAGVGVSTGRRMIAIALADQLGAALSRRAA